MRVTVIGANSYIARNLIRKLKEVQPDCELKLYDREEHQLDGETGYQRIHVLDRASIAMVDLDCDVVFMFVGKTGNAAGFQDYESFIDINEKALLNLLSVYSEQNSQAKIIFPSTRLVYSGGTGLLKETAPKDFKTVYAVNKFACEKYLQQFSHMYGLRYCIFRICVPYGSMIPAASSYGTIEFMLKKASTGQDITLYGDGSVRRTFTHIEDLCENMIEGALSSVCLNDVYNIGGEDMSLRTTAEQIASRFNVGIKYVPYPEEALKIETGDTVFDAAKLESLGIKPHRTFSMWVDSLTNIAGGGVYCRHRFALIVYLCPLNQKEGSASTDLIRTFIIEDYQRMPRAA